MWRVFTELPMNDAVSFKSREKPPEIGLSWRNKGPMGGRIVPPGWVLPKADSPIGGRKESRGIGEFPQLSVSAFEFEMEGMKCQRRQWKC